MSKSHNTKKHFVLRTLSEFRKTGGSRIADLRLWYETTTMVQTKPNLLKEC